MRIKRPLTADELKEKQAKSIRRKKDPDFKALVRHIVLISLSAVFVLTLFVFDYFLPFRTLVPAYSFPRREEGEMRVHFLDVGQGDAALFEFPGGDCLLVDTGDGSFGNEDHLYRYLKGIAPSSLTVLLSHTDYDHSGGLQFLLEYYPPDAVYIPVSHSLSSVTEVPVYTYSRYDVLTWSGGAYAVCLSPYSLEEGTGNDTSGVFYIKYHDTAILMPGDISSVRERRLLKEYALDGTLFDSGEYRVRLEDVDILKVSHHGSASSSAAEWLSLLSPSVAVISCGEGNPYGHPKPDALTRLGQVAEIYRTDELGDIVISITADGFTVVA